MPKKPNLETNNSNEMINFYENKKLKELLTEYHNPHFAATKSSTLFLYI